MRSSAAFAAWVIAVYFDQFEIVRVCGMVTNASLMLSFAVTVYWVLSGSTALVPARWPVVIELVHSAIGRMVHDNAGPLGRGHYPFILGLFTYLLIVNVLGLFPYVFTPTAHVALTFGASLTVLIGVTVIGFKRNGVDYFSILMPNGAPMALAPMLIIIETASYLSRAISLGVRLAANLSAGHLLFAILAGFGYQGCLMMHGGLVVLSAAPVVVMACITALECGVAAIQAYVFCLLTTLYLGECTIPGAGVGILGNRRA
ncbi:MAG: F0F1 ATP synthase subunit A [Parvularculales bacterium]